VCVWSPRAKTDRTARNNLIGSRKNEIGETSVAQLYGKNAGGDDGGGSVYEWDKYEKRRRPSASYVFIKAHVECSTTAAAAAR